MARSVYLSCVALIKIEALLLLSMCIGNNHEYFSTQPNLPPSCDTTNSSIVRKFVEKNWNKLLHRYGVTLPIECPLHSHRDLFGDREKVKLARSSHWECRKCGKKFFNENYLDLHLERKHSEITNMREDSVCLGDYCDVVRCSVIQHNSILLDETKSTDVSLWVPHMTTNKGGGQTTPRNARPDEYNAYKYGLHSRKTITSQTSDTPNPAITHCDQELLSKLRKKCEDLVWNCMQGLINTLDLKDFKMAQSDLESGVCSFLSCDRYADMSSPLQLSGPLRPFLLVFGSLLISLCLAVAYYFAWIYSQSPEELNRMYDDQDYHQRQYDSHKDYQSLYNPNLPNRTTRI